MKSTSKKAVVKGHKHRAIKNARSKRTKKGAPMARRTSQQHASAACTASEKAGQARITRRKKAAEKAHKAKEE